MKYVVSAMSIVNDLHYADGKEVKRVLGGGLFMLGGIMSYTPEVAFVTAAGPDFEVYHGEFFARHGLSTDGVHRTLPYTHYTTLTYQPDASWTEVSNYGANYEVENAYNTMVHGDWIAPLCDAETKAVYTESGAEELFWNPEEVAKVRAAAPDAKLMWEVCHYNIFNPAQKPLVAPALEQVDLFSVNLREARELFNVTDERDVVKAIQDTGKSCFLRMGVKGSCVVIPGEDPVFVPSVGLERTVDPTGCGNCSTAASTVGFAEGWSPARIAAFANVAADYNALQLGPYPHYTDEVRAMIRRDTDELEKKARLLFD
ncbi:MAG: carbohydrate kinase family protein [Lachnospiraceae bacterium]|nr:carbohydrate kinase family protein [Lachnospiraceae bacterium]